MNRYQIIAAKATLCFFIVFGLLSCSGYKQKSADSPYFDEVLNDLDMPGLGYYIVVRCKYRDSLFSITLENTLLFRIIKKDTPLDKVGYVAYLKNAEINNSCLDIKSENTYETLKNFRIVNKSIIDTSVAQLESYYFPNNILRPVSFEQRNNIICGILFRKHEFIHTSDESGMILIYRPDKKKSH